MTELISGVQGAQILTLRSARFCYMLPLKRQVLSQGKQSAGSDSSSRPRRVQKLYPGRVFISAWFGFLFRADLYLLVSSIGQSLDSPSFSRVPAQDTKQADPC